MKKYIIKAAIVNWWLAQKPFGMSVEEYLERPSNWVAGHSKELADIAAVLYKERHEKYNTEETK